MSSYSENHETKKQGTKLPPVGENIIFDFNYILDLITGPYERDILDYPSCIFRLRNLLIITETAIKEEGLNLDYFINEAEKLKEKYKGDILPPLNKLGTFRPPSPREKKEYLLTLLWFLFSADEYIIDKMRYSVFLSYLKSERGKRELESLKDLKDKINNLGSF